MKEIKLTQGKVALIDDLDFVKINQHKWFFDHGYAKRNKNIYMHREIMNTPEGMDTDHVNGDGLDNRRDNLRICTHNENVRNCKIGKNNKVGYKCIEKRGLKWRAYIVVNGIKNHLGYFNDSSAAASAYDTAAKKYFGEFAKTNFL
jgi:hypothetical protein